jgi:5'-3' exonuclease
MQHRLLHATTCMHGPLFQPHGAPVCLQGVGAKTAKQLVQSFGTVEQISQQLAGLCEAEQQQVRPRRAGSLCCRLCTLDKLPLLCIQFTTSAFHRTLYTHHESPLMCIHFTTAAV